MFSYVLTLSSLISICPSLSKMTPPLFKCSLIRSPLSRSPSSLSLTLFLILLSPYMTLLLIGWPKILFQPHCDLVPVPRLAWPAWPMHGADLMKCIDRVSLDCAGLYSTDLMTNSCIIPVFLLVECLDVCVLLIQMWVRVSKLCGTLPLKKLHLSSLSVMKATTSLSVTQCESLGKSVSIIRSDLNTCWGGVFLTSSTRLLVLYRKDHSNVNVVCQESKAVC